MAVTISHSETESYKLCPRKHYYGYGLGIERVATSDALSRGKLGHSMLEVYYTAKMQGTPKPEAVARDFLKNSMDGTNSTIVDELAKMFNWHMQADPFANYKILAVEEAKVLEISADLEFPFIVDMVVQDPMRRIAVVDHKFVYDFFTVNDIAISPQIPMYIAANRAMGTKVNYGIYNQLRYRKVKTPTLDSQNSFVEFFPNEGRLLRTFDEYLMLAGKIQTQKQLPLGEQSYEAVRVANKMVCKSCSFFALCSAELNDTNPALVARTEYKIRERRTFEVEGRPSTLQITAEVED